MPRKPPDSSSAKGNESELNIDGRKVRLTRLDKVLYPETGTTKADVIDYYIRVSGFILPHLSDHPITLKRYPDGVKGDALWDKDAPSFAPEWVNPFPVPRHAGGPDINYVLINDRATLAWTANIAALELHPFLHRVPTLDVPTSIVFDLDPGAGADILKCIEVAFIFRELFDQLELQSFPKVSGSKGLQLYVPLNTPTSYEVTQPFARTVAELIEKQHPDLAVSTMAKEKRSGKVFIDWSQNPEIGCSLGEDWQFGRIQIPPLARSGLINLVSEDRFPGVVFSFVRRLEQSFSNIFPAHSAIAVSDFWQSWQVHKHISDFCFELGTSRAAAQLAGAGTFRKRRLVERSDLFWVRLGHSRSAPL